MIAAYSNSELVAATLEEAGTRVPAASVQLKEQLVGVQADIRKTEEALERYFLALESGTMNEQVCSDRVELARCRLVELSQHRESLSRQAVAVGSSAHSRSEASLRSTVQASKIFELKGVVQALVRDARVSG